MKGEKRGLDGADGSTAATMKRYEYQMLREKMKMKMKTRRMRVEALAGQLSG